MTPAQLLEQALSQQPRLQLAHLPTPLEVLPRLSEKLGGPRIWIKRDDMTGLALGGNKTRQLEYVFAQVLAQGCDSVVIGAYSQSNWCRQATAAAAKLGLSISLVLLHGEKGPKLQGNLLLDRLMGADVTVTGIETMEELQPLLDAKADELRKAGKTPFMIEPLGLQSLALGALGYVGAALELDSQFNQHDINPSHIFMCGAHMTPAGMGLGLKALERQTRLMNVTPIKWSMPRSDHIVEIANMTATMLGIGTRLDAKDFDSTDEFIGTRYGVVSASGHEAMLLAAREEAIILDPVYSAKSMAGMIAAIRSGLVTQSDDIVFVHTGGIPALFAYSEDLDLE